MNSTKKLTKSVFEDLFELENCIDIFLDTHDVNQPIIMFGAGFALKKILIKFEEKGFNVVAICDNDKSKQGTYYDGIYQIISIEDSIKRYPNALYIISTPLYFCEIEGVLKNFIPEERICKVDFECAHYFSGRDFKSFFMDNIIRFENLYNNLSDNISKDTLYNVVKAHCSGKRKDFTNALSEKDDWYLFNTLLNPNKDSVYLDCGAYDGDTVLLFSEAAKNGYNSIIALEPDKSIKTQFLDKISNSKIENVELIEKGAFDYNGVLKFASSGVYSAVLDANKSIKEEAGYIEIEVATIDSILNDRRVDIIKMDIEGSEYKALVGAMETIKKYKPRLAICLYHNIEDFVNIPELILQMVPQYKLYLRHHSKSCTDTILYAVFEK